MLNMALRFLILFTIFAGLAPADPPTMFPPVRGTREMVGAANNLEVESGFRILGQGGNAVDAGVASVLAAAVSEQSRFGLGGEMPLLIKMSGKPVIAISGVGTAPASATIEYFQKRSMEPWEDGQKMPPIPAQGIRAAILPGVLDGLLRVKEGGDALADYWRLPRVVSSMRSSASCGRTGASVGSTTRGRPISIPTASPHT